MIKEEARRVQMGGKDKREAEKRKGNKSRPS